MNSCKRSTETSASLLDLHSPNNTVIANSVDELKLLLAPAINKKFKTEVNIEITKISYLAVKDGAIADIEYITNTGVATNIILMKEVKTPFSCSAKHVEGFIGNKKATESTGLILSCAGETCCKVHARLNPDGSLNYDCSCDNCEMRIQYI